MYRYTGFGDLATTALTTPLVVTSAAPISTTQNTLLSLYSFPLTQLCKLMPAAAPGAASPGLLSICEQGLGFNPVAIVLPGVIWATALYLLFKGRGVKRGR